MANQIIPECTVDAHPMRQQIIDSFKNHVSIGSVWKSIEPKVSRSALQRFRLKVLAPSISISRDSMESSSCVSKPWAEAEYVRIYNMATAGKRKDLPSARAALDSICRLNGYDAPKRSESLTMNLHAFRSDQLAGQLSAALHALPEADRRALLAEEPAIEAEVLPPGE